MIGPGSLPRPFARHRSKAVLYVRRVSGHRPRRARPSPPRPPRVHRDVVSFDHRPVEFPIATLVPRARRDRTLAVAGALRAWLELRWGWLRPRLVPVIAAAFGTLVVIATMDYMTLMAHR